MNSKVKKALPWLCASMSLGAIVALSIVVNRSHESDSSVQSSNWHFDGHRAPADDGSVNVEADTGIVTDPKKPSIDEIRQKIRANRARLANNRQRLADQINDGQDKVQNGASSAKQTLRDRLDQGRDRISQGKDKISDAKARLSRGVSDLTDKGAAQASDAKEDARTLVRNVRANASDAIANARAAASDEISAGREALENVKEEIRARHGDLTVKNPRVTVFREGNEFYIKVEGQDKMLRFNTDTFDSETGVDLLGRVPASASITVTTFRDLVSSLVDEIKSECQKKIRPEDSLNSKQKENLDRAANRITAFRAKQLFDRIGDIAGDSLQTAKDKASDAKDAVEAGADRVKATVGHHS